MTDKQQTAVSWLRGQLEVTHDPAIREWLFDQALSMEEEQIEAAYLAGYKSEMTIEEHMNSYQQI